MLMNPEFVHEVQNDPSLLGVEVQLFQVEVHRYTYDSTYWSVLHQLFKMNRS